MWHQGLGELRSLSPVARVFSFSEGQRDAALPTARESPVLASPRSCPCHGGRKSPTVLLSVPTPDLQRYQPAAEGAIASGVLIALTSYLLSDSIRYRRGSCDALRISGMYIAF